jgi:hypothetical protein
MAEWQTAKMAESGRFMPKWQAKQILCQTICQNGIGEIFSDYFLYLQNADTKYRLGVERLEVFTTKD